jgi:hypothetical protein
MRAAAKQSSDLLPPPPQKKELLSSSAIFLCYRRLSLVDSMISCETVVAIDFVVCPWNSYCLTNKQISTMQQSFWKADSALSCPNSSTFPSPRLYITFRSMLDFYVAELYPTRSPESGRLPLFNDPRLFSIFAALFHICRPAPSATWGQETYV